MSSLLDELDTVLAGDTTEPDDVLKRLYPSAYRDDDEAEKEFRTLTEAGLRHDRTDRIEACLTQAQGAGLVQFGLFRQRAALITCMVPSAQRPDHIHFVDGASIRRSSPGSSTTGSPQYRTPSCRR